MLDPTLGPPPPPPPPLRPRLRPGQLLRFPYQPSGNHLHARVVAADQQQVALDLLISTPEAPQEPGPPIRIVSCTAHILSIWEPVR